MNSDIDIRFLTAEDIPNVVQIHADSFLGYRSTKLGPAFLRKMYRWYLTRQPKLSLVATRGGEVVGFVTGSIGGSSQKIFRYALPEILWGFIRQPKLFFQDEMYEMWRSHLWGLLTWLRKKYRLGGIKEENLTESQTVKGTLDSIAVSQRTRGKNIGKALVYVFEEAASELGATHLGLGVEYDNTTARALYNSCGWFLVRENRINNSAHYAKELR